MMRADKPLSSPARVRELLERHGLRADKRFGQNFLVDAGALHAIVAAAEVASTDTVFEVGAGLGVLTLELAKRAGRVISVELDRRLLPALHETLAGLANVEIVHGDALAFDMHTLPAASLMVANLPYNVATPLIVRALDSGRFARLVFLVQREVALRLCAEPEGESFGALSLIVRHFAHARRVCDVKPSAFYPPPEVTSSVVRLDVIPGQRADAPTFALIRQAFAHRRKTLHKNLTMAGYRKGDVQDALAALGLEPQVRAEALPLETFRALADRLGKRDGE
jgi:16S rRNA (adenine1518-N6/adenine1519-N6)-dimethyltransferase